MHGLVSRRPGARLAPPLLLLAAAAIGGGDRAEAVKPFPPYNTFPCSPPTCNCGGDSPNAYTDKKDHQEKASDRSAGSTCAGADNYGNCFGSLNGKSCPGSLQWCMPPRILSVAHAPGANPGEVQLDIEYDFPNNYCQVWADGINGCSCGNPGGGCSWPPRWDVGNTRMYVRAGNNVLVESRPAFEHGRWRPTIGGGAACKGATTYTIQLLGCAPGPPFTVSVTQDYTPAPSLADCPQVPPNACPAGPGHVPPVPDPTPAFAIAPLSGPLQPAFFYNGNNPDSRGMGPSWSFDYAESLVAAGDGQLIWTDVRGLKVLLVGSDAGGYRATVPGDVVASATRSGGDYTVGTPDGVLRTFVAGSGFWRRTIDRWGNGADGDATAMARATHVRELASGTPTGREIALAWDGAGRLTSISDVNGHATGLTYDGGGRLASLCPPSHACPLRRYAYDGATSRLATISDSAGQVLRGYQYDKLGNVSATWVGAAAFAQGKERARFVIAGDTVTVKRERGDGTTMDTIYTSEIRAGMYRVLKIEGACADCGVENTAYVLDKNTGRVIEEADGNGVGSTRTIDAAGNVTRLVEAVKTAVQRETIFVYADPQVDPLPAPWGRSVGDFWKKKIEPSGVKPGALVETTRSWGGKDNLVLTETVTGYVSAGGSPVSRTRTITHDPAGRVLALDGPRSDAADVTRFEYWDAAADPANRMRLQRRTEPDGTVTTFDAYHPLGGVAQETRDGVIRTGTWDDAGRPLAKGVKATGNNEKDLVVTNTYDGEGRLVAVESGEAGAPPLERTRYGWEPGTGRLLTRTLSTAQNGAGDRTTYGYDEWGNVSREAQGYFDGTKTTIDYEVTREYDARSRVRKEIRPADGAIVRHDYDGAGNLAGTADANHYTGDDPTRSPPNTAYRYDARNRLIAVIRKTAGGDDVTAYEYDARDQRIKTIDANGAATLFEYDDFGDLRVRRTALGGGGPVDATFNEYDEAGNLIATRNRERATHRTYDAANRLLTVTGEAAVPDMGMMPDRVANSGCGGCGGSPARLDGAAQPGMSLPPLSIAYFHDKGCAPDPRTGKSNGQGRLCSMSDESGTTTWGYDRRGLVVVEERALAGGRTYRLEYEHDAAGRRIGITYPTRERVTTAHDAGGRPVGLGRTVNNNMEVTLLGGITHRAGGPIASFVTAGGLVEDRRFDTRRRRIEQRTSTMGGQPILSFQYKDWDKAGNLKALAQDGGAFDRTFAYDPDRYLLTSSTGPYGPNAATQTIDWKYDRMGNRLAETRSGAGTITYRYGDDGAGHGNGVLARIDPAGPPGPPGGALRHLGTGDLEVDELGLHHEYDDLGRLRAVSYESKGCDPAAKVELVRDGAGHRAIRRVTRCGANAPDGREDFVYGSDGNLYFRAAYDGAGRTLEEETYVYLEDEPIAILRASAPADNGAFFLHGDHLGRPVAMSRDDRIVWRGEFEPFGGRLKPQLQVVSFEPHFRFPGQWEDLDSIGPITAGLPLDNFHRSYLGRLGRYSQPDPYPSTSWRDGNPFLYARADPLRTTDRLGLYAVDGTCDCDPNRTFPPVGRTIAQSCRYIRNPRCQEALRARSAVPIGSHDSQNLLDCFKRRCSPEEVGKGPRIYCRVRNENCGWTTPSGDITLYTGNDGCPRRVQHNQNNGPRDYSQSLFHETLHTCGIGENHPAWFYDITRICTDWEG